MLVEGHGQVRRCSWKWCLSASRETNHAFWVSNKQHRCGGQVGGALHLMQQLLIISDD